MSTPADGHQPSQYQPGQGQPGQYQQPNGGYGYPPQQPPKKKGGCLKIGCIGLAVLAALILVIVIIVAAVSGGGEDSSTDTSSETTTTDQSTGEAEQDVAEEPAAEGDTLTLEGTSTGTASSNYGPMGSSSTADFTGTWSEEITDAEPADGYGVTIQDMSGAEDAEVTCTIKKGDEVVAEETATGAFSITTCTQPIF